jgi:hypothetical protein
MHFHHHYMSAMFTSLLLAACGSPTAYPTATEGSTGSGVPTAKPITKETPTQTPIPTFAVPPTVGATSAVVIAVASITLADDCQRAGKAEAAETSAKMKADSMGKNSMSRMRRIDAPCVQTSVQLELRSSATAATTVTLRKIELLDDSGKVLGELTARTPDRWTDAGYVAWDQSLAAGATVKASWPLSAPNWTAYGTTKAAAAGHSHQVRLTVAVNGIDQVVAGQAIVTSPPAISEPMVKT